MHTSRSRRTTFSHLSGLPAKAQHLFDHHAFHLSVLSPMCNMVAGVRICPGLISLQAILLASVQPAKAHRNLPQMCQLCKTSPVCS